MSDITPPTKTFYVTAGTWSADGVLDALRDWTEFVGQPPRSNEWRGRADEGHEATLWERHYPRWPSASTVIDHHRTWRAALMTAGLPGGAPPPELPLQERIKAARRMRGAGLRITLIASELGVSAGTVHGYLGARLCDCGAGYVVSGIRCKACALKRASAAATVTEWTREEVVQAIRRWIELESRPPTTLDWQPGRQARGRWAREYPRWPTTRQLQQLFGSWNAAIEGAGLTPGRRPIDEHEAIAALRRAHLKLGDALSYGSYAAWAARNGQPSMTVLVRHFGCWNDARRAAGLRRVPDC